MIGGRIEFHFYNLSRDCVDKLVSQSSALGEWFTARSSVLRSIVSQKLGLFHNQPFMRTEWRRQSRYLEDGTHVEALLKHTQPSPPLTRPKHDVSDFQNVYRNSKMCKPQKLCRGKNKDYLKISGKQIFQVWSSENKQNRQLLYHLWNSRGENCNISYSEELIKYFKLKSRLIHYVFTPLLFLPQWRREANETRERVAPVDQSAVADTAKPTPTSEKVRNSSGGGPAAHLKTIRSKSIASQAASPAVAGKSPIASPKPLRVFPDEKFHTELVSNYFQEYEQYLQTLGFTIIVISQGNGRRNAKPSLESNDKTNRRRRETGATVRSNPRVVYLQKSYLGGLLIFEIGISRPFFYTKLHALEAQRLHPISNHNSINKSFTNNFLEECDNIKILIHLHSFTYDYHLRMVSTYLAQKPSLLRKGFHIVSFLEDLMKYYSKGPNFARNFIYAGSLDIISQVGHLMAEQGASL